MYLRICTEGECFKIKLMKKIVLLLIVIGTAFSCSTKKAASKIESSATTTIDIDTLISFSFLDRHEIYRDVDNYITVSVSPIDLDYKVICTTCDTIYEGDFPNVYIVRPGKVRQTILTVVSDTVPSTVYRHYRLTNQRLPNPSLFFGGTINGSKASRHANRIDVKYPSGMLQKFNFEVLSWNLYIGEKSFNGEGNSLSEEAKNYLRNDKSAEVVSITTVVKGQDGVERKLGGVFGR